MIEIFKSCASKSCSPKKRTMYPVYGTVCETHATFHPWKKLSVENNKTNVN